MIEHWNGGHFDPRKSGMSVPRFFNCPLTTDHRHLPFGFVLPSIFPTDYRLLASSGFGLNPAGRHRPAFASLAMLVQY
jgi:hypothetical protein